MNTEVENEIRKRIVDIETLEDNIRRRNRLTQNLISIAIGIALIAIVAGFSIWSLLQ